MNKRISDSDQSRGSGRLFFEKMISSVANQSYGRENIEHIIVDGASSDGTLEIIRYYKNKNLINHYISEKDSSVYDAMNKGRMLASGDYCLFLNSDDYLSTDAIELLVNKAKSSSADYIYADAAIIQEDGTLIGHHHGNESRVFFGMPYNHQTLLVSRQVYQNVDFPMDFQITTWKYAYDLFASNYYGARVAKTIGYFRHGGLSTSSQTREVFINEQNSIKNFIATTVGITREQYDGFKLIAEREGNLNPKTFIDIFGSIKQFQHLVNELLESENAMAIKFLNLFLESTIANLSLGH
jgi:glycosyltransferase involved in cell wall biosynthesis